MPITQSVYAELNRWLDSNGHGEIAALQTLGGGDIHESYKLSTTQKTQLCLKYQHNAPSNFFLSEAQGLQAIRDSRAISSPEVLLVGNDFLLLEYIEPGNKTLNFWQRLGRQLAAMHQPKCDCFGFTDDNYCGLTPQPNPKLNNGFDFFREARILYQSQRAFDKGLLTNKEVLAVEKLVTKLEQLLPLQPPSLIHGDLWSGNIHANRQEEPYLIDPAAHWGWPEAELAMTLLFGGFDSLFYRSYEECFAIATDWRDRAPVYNLYHLMNHLNLFGSAYHSSVMNVVGRFQ